MNGRLDLANHIEALAPWAQRLRREALLIGPDEFVSHCYSQYGPRELEALLLAVTDQASEAAGVQLYPVNSFLRRYEHGAVLKRHRDRQEIEWTASIVLHHEGPDWPLHTPYGPMYGPTIFLKSGTVEHWRNRFEGELSVVGLLHWNTRGSQTPDTPSFAHVSQVLSREQIGDLYRQFDATTLRPGMVLHHGVSSDNRVSKVAWLNRKNGWQWLYDALYQAANSVNRLYWNLDISGLSIDEIQFSRYAPGAYYGWHRDSDPASAGQTSKRSLSVVCLIGQSEAGGGLELRNGGVVGMAPGDAVIFPAIEEHRALQVKAGVRDSLVLWLSRD